MKIKIKNNHASQAKILKLGAVTTMTMGGKGFNNEFGRPCIDFGTRKR